MTASLATVPEPANIHRGPTTIEILRATSKHFGVPVERLTGLLRHATIVRARHVAMYLVRQECGLSYPAIGRIFHRDHSTVLTAVHSVEEMPAHSQVGVDIARIRVALRAHAGGTVRLVSHSDCAGCNKLRAQVEALQVQLSEAYQLLDGAR